MTPEQKIRAFIHKHGIKNGDAILTNITPINWSKHYFIVLDVDNLQFIQNSYGKGVNRPSLLEVALELDSFKRIVYFNGHDYQRYYVIQNALEIESRKPQYSLFFYNCEDFVREAWTGVPASTQVDFAALIFGSVGVFSLMYGIAKNHKGAKIIGSVAIIATIATLAIREDNRNNLIRIKNSQLYI